MRVIVNIGWMLSEISFSGIYIYYLNNQSNSPKKLNCHHLHFYRWGHWGLESLGSYVAQIGGGTNEITAQEGRFCVRMAYVSE